MSEIIVNGEDLATTASKCPAFQTNNPYCAFNWCAVRRAFEYYSQQSFKVQIVCKQVTLYKNPPPEQLRAYTVQSPVIDEDGERDGRGAERVLVLRLAGTYACPFVDN